MCSAGKIRRMDLPANVLVSHKKGCKFLIMEIRPLTPNELQWAVNTANEVFEICVRPQVRTQSEIDNYYRYARADYLWQEMSTGRLFLWGAFENGQMCAVSAIEYTGRIMMLYVKPGFWHRRVGMQLLNGMCSYAFTMLGQQRITIDAVPLAAASFFYRMGFTLVPGAPLGASAVSLERYAVPQPYGAMNGYPSTYYTTVPYGAPVSKKPEVTYPTRKVKPKVILGIMTTVLLLSALIVSGLTVYHIAAGERYTEENYYFEQAGDTV